MTRAFEAPREWHRESDLKRAKKMYFGESGKVKATEDEINGFVDWVLHDFRDAATRRTAIENYLRTRDAKLRPVERELLQSLRDARFGLFETVRVEPRSGVQLRDIFAGDSYFVHDISSSHTMHRWDCLLVRIQFLEGRWLMTGNGMNYNNATRVMKLYGQVRGQIAALRARLEVFEARQVPYSAEELALFKAPEPKLASTEPNAGKKSPRALPAGAASLVLEAQRYFADKRLDKAEEKYIQVLHQDEKNVYLLANLAAIQLELGHLADAEKHINQAVALASNDAYSLSILGYLRFKQQKYEEALDALSRAAKLEPENAEIQNYLGLTLAQKGLRGPAEPAKPRWLHGQAMTATVRFE